MSSRPAPDSTAHLLSLYRGGDEAARDRLLARYLPILRRWAHGRLPAAGRGMTDTDDLVQVTLVRVLKQIESFRAEREGAFLAYLRQTLLNALRDELRRASSRTQRDAISEEIPDAQASLLEQAIGRDTLDAYEEALATLPEAAREAVILRLEFQMSYQEIADAIGSPSANAARMAVSRSIAHLSTLLGKHR